MAARRGLLNPSTLRQVTSFHLRYLMPCTVLHLNQVLTLERTLSWSPVLLVTLLHIAIGAGLGRLCAWLLGLRSPLRECLVMITGFGNCGSLPFVLILPVAKAWSLTASDPHALGKGTALVGLYLTVWFLLFFSLGTAYLSRATRAHYSEKPLKSSTLEASSKALPLHLQDVNANDSAAPTASPQSFGRCVSCILGLRHTNRIIACMLLSLGLGAWEPAREALGETGPLNWLGFTIESLGQTGVVVGTIILGASLWDAFAKAPSQSHTLRAANEAGIEALGLASGGEAGKGDAVGPMSREPQMLDSTSGQAVPSEGVEQPRARLLISASVVIRLFLMPLVAMPINLWLARIGVLPCGEPMIMLVFDAPYLSCVHSLRTSSSHDTAKMSCC